MKRPSDFLILSLVASLFAFSGRVEADEAAPSKPAKKFIRLLRDDADRPLALQTPIVRYARVQAASSPTVDLIGAIHVGDKAYYRRLNEIFRRYDSVLYELVAPEDKRVPQSEGHAGNPVSALQLGLKNMLALEHQLDGIDYSQPNLVHADLSPHEFAESMADRGESFVQMFFRALGQGVALQSRDPGRTSDVQLLAALLSRNRSLQLKRVMAEQFQDSLAATTLFDGPDGSTIITVRNKRAMDVLAKQIRAGKKKIAIFYGAAHLSDMERQLLERFRYKPASQQWLTAWDLATTSAAAAAR